MHLRRITIIKMNVNNLSVTNENDVDAFNVACSHLFVGGSEWTEPQVGPPGPAGEAATVAVGTTITLAPSSAATVSNTGTSSAGVFNFGIPQGVQGQPGARGATGSVITTYKGLWSSSTTYQTGDIATFPDNSNTQLFSTYICMLGPVQGEWPSDMNHWQFIASHGAAGQQGNPGSSPSTTELLAALAASAGFIALQAQVGALQDSVAALTTVVVDQGKAIGALAENVGTLQGEVSTLQDHQTVLDTKTRYQSTPTGSGGSTLTQASTSFAGKSLIKTTENGTDVVVLLSATRPSTFALGVDVSGGVDANDLHIRGAVVGGVVPPSAVTLSYDAPSQFYEGVDISGGLTSDSFSIDGAVALNANMASTFSQGLAVVGDLTSDSLAIKGPTVAGVAPAAAVLLNTSTASTFSLGATVTGGFSSDQLTVTGALTAPGLVNSADGRDIRIGATGTSLVSIGNPDGSYQ